MFYQAARREQFIRRGGPHPQGQSHTDASLILPRVPSQPITSSVHLFHDLCYVNRNKSRPESLAVKHPPYFCSEKGRGRKSLRFAWLTAKKPNNWPIEPALQRRAVNSLPILVSVASVSSSLAKKRLNLSLLKTSYKGTEHRLWEATANLNPSSTTQNVARVCLIMTPSLLTPCHLYYTPCRPRRLSDSSETLNPLLSNGLRHLPKPPRFSSIPSSGPQIRQSRADRSELAKSTSSPSDVPGRGRHGPG